MKSDNLPCMRSHIYIWACLMDSDMTIADGAKLPSPPLQEGALQFQESAAHLLKEVLQPTAVCCMSGQDVITSSKSVTLFPLFPLFRSPHSLPFIPSISFSSFCRITSQSLLGFRTNSDIFPMFI